MVCLGLEGTTGRKQLSQDFPYYSLQNQRASTNDPPESKLFASIPTGFTLSVSVPTEFHFSSVTESTPSVSTPGREGAGEEKGSDLPPATSRVEI